MTRLHLTTRYEEATRVGSFAEATLLGEDFCHEHSDIARGATVNEAQTPEGDWIAEIVLDANAPQGDSLFVVREGATTREIAGNRFIGRRTPKGIVVREMHRGEAIAQWFVPTRGGPPLRMPFGGGPFELCLGEREAERVAFFARRMPEAD